MKKLMQLLEKLTIAITFAERGAHGTARDFLR